MEGIQKDTKEVLMSFSNKKKFWIAFGLGFVISLVTVVMISCGHHKRYRHTVYVDDRPIVVNFVNDRSPEDQKAIIEYLLEEIDRWKLEHGEPDLNINIVVDVDVTVIIEGDLDEANHEIRCHPFNNRCRIYHALCKWHKKKCNSDKCLKTPKPCDNED